jgi:hypothetical protein
MAAVCVFPWGPRPVFLTNAGAPLANGTITFYAAGSSSLLQTFSDEALSVPNPNPLSLNSAGRTSVSATEVNVYPLAQAYKIVVADSLGTPVYTSDHIEPCAPFNVVSGGLVNVVITNPTVTGGVFTSPEIDTSLISTGLFQHLCQGRLTLTSGTAITTADVTAATSVFFTPFNGATVALFDGVSKWTVLPFTELTIALGTLTSGLPYDVFLFNNAGTPGLRAPVAWSSATARVTSLVLQNGVLVKSGATTDRYLGTFCTTATTTTEDSAANRFLFNYYNRAWRRMQRIESTSSWAYVTGAWRQANGSMANQLNFVVGVSDYAIEAEVIGSLANSGAANVAAAVGIGLDSTSVLSGDSLQGAGASSNTAVQGANAKYLGYPGLGKHALVWLEFGAANNTFFGTNGVDVCGMYGSIWA